MSVMDFSPECSWQRRPQHDPQPEVYNGSNGPPQCVCHTGTEAGSHAGSCEWQPPGCGHSIAYGTSWWLL